VTGRVRGRVAVVGGGLAGLTAAWRLKSAGAQVTLLEARQRTGGHLVREKLAGVEFEPSWPVVPASAPALSGLVHELGLGARVERTAIERAVLADGRRQRPIELSPVSRRGFSGLRRRRIRRLLEWFGPMLDARRPELAVRLDDRSVADFARLYLGRAVDPEQLGPLFESAFGLDSSDTSRLLFMLLMDAAAGLRVESVSGLSVLAEALASRLDDVRLETPVASVGADGRSLTLVSGEKLETDAVVVALCTRRARGLVESFLPGERAFFDAGRRVERLHLAVALGSELTAPLTWLPRKRGGTLSAIVAVDSRLALLVARPRDLHETTESDERRAERLLSEAGAVWPSLARGVEGTLVCRPGATPEFGVGHYRRMAALREAQAAAPDRALFFADPALVGPHCEGAVQSAERAAADALALLDR